nr:immunoglobulin heavy chain junction region [Mus musculus]NSM04274.1 immunoglobulin heavy chain junction region [Mus musculus]NSM05784.1 immunoglobulin heavy chain junction region [Mus musculus]NSM06634.1 immunoglobulin heavy chain junction region [Mus musculus]NSM06750.1 immunoglobulin heavy chain junction region [Mus musculus]
CAIGWPFDYW